MSIRSRSSGAGFWSEEAGSATRQPLPSTTSPRIIRFTWQETMVSLFLRGAGGCRNKRSRWADAPMLPHFMKLTRPPPIGISCIDSGTHFSWQAFSWHFSPVKQRKPSILVANVPQPLSEFHFVQPFFLLRFMTWPARPEGANVPTGPLVHTPHGEV